MARPWYRRWKMFSNERPEMVSVSGLFCRSLTHLHELVVKCPGLSCIDFPCSAPSKATGHGGGTWGNPRQEIYWAFAHLMQKANQTSTSVGISQWWPSTGGTGWGVVPALQRGLWSFWKVPKARSDLLMSFSCWAGAAACQKKPALEVSVMLFLFPELPAGWEKIEDPVYGVYYVE